MSKADSIRVQVDVCHPAHVHLFRHAIEDLRAGGHETLVTSREKEVTTDLLDAYGIDHRAVSTQGTSVLGLASEWIRRETRLIRIARSFDPDVVLSHHNPAAVHAARAAGADAIVFNDDEAASGILRRFIDPFASVICTPIGFRRDFGVRQRRYDGLHELAYLHPDRFSPDPDLLREYGVDPEEPYFVLRFVGWNAHHDVGEAGLSPGAKRDLVESLDRRGDVYISTEDGLPADLATYGMPVPPEHVHHLLAFADLYAGDSQTMAIEAAVLGTPSVRSNSFAMAGALGHFAVLEEEYGLVHSIGDEREALATVRELVADPDTGKRWEKRRRRLLADSVDVTSFMLDTVAEVSGVTVREDTPAVGADRLGGLDPL